MKRISLMCGVALLLAACGAPTTPATEETASPAVTANTEPCPDDGPRFPATGFCTGRISNYLDPNIGLVAYTPDGCDWGYSELPFPTGDEALIYRSLTCKGVTTTLEFHGGARSAELGYTVSALFDVPADFTDPVRVFVADPADPQKAIRDLFEGIPADERPKCEIRKINLEGWPTDALDIAYSDAERAKLPQDEPIAMCGEFGRDEDSATYWRVFGGYAWFFNMGQDAQDFDPGSFMIFRKDAAGAWNLVP